MSTIESHSTCSPNHSVCSDEDLIMAALDSAQQATAVQNEAYRQALSEVAGELYVEAYKASMNDAIQRYRSRWNLE